MAGTALPSAKPRTALCFHPGQTWPTAPACPQQHHQGMSNKYFSSLQWKQDLGPLSCKARNISGVCSRWQAFHLVSGGTRGCLVWVNGKNKYPELFGNYTFKKHITEKQERDIGCVFADVQ